MIVPPQDTPAYQLLRKHNLLETRFRLENSSQIDSVHANSNRWLNLLVAAPFRRPLCRLPIRCLKNTSEQANVSECEVANQLRGSTKFTALISVATMPIHLFCCGIQVNVVCVPFKCCGFFQTFEVPAGHVTPVMNGSKYGTFITADRCPALRLPVSFGA
jgi:hypothetical protein